MDRLEMKRRLFPSTSTYKIWGIMQIALLSILEGTVIIYIVEQAGYPVSPAAIWITALSLLLILVPIGYKHGPFLFKEHMIRTFYCPTKKEITSYASRERDRLLELLEHKYLPEERRTIEQELKELEPYLS